MPKFFIPSEGIRGGQIRLGSHNTTHLKALRLKNGDLLTVTDGSGTEYSCIFRGMDGDEGIAELYAQSSCQTEASLCVSVFAAMPKGDKAEFILQKCVELGVYEVFFFLSSRSVSRPDPKAVLKRMERLARVSEEAAMQSGRGRIPNVAWLRDFPAMVRMASGSDLSVFLWEEAREKSLRTVLQSHRGSFDSISVITGPEGGFSGEEAELAAGGGLIPVTIGKRILRCETAPLCAVSAIMYETGNLE